MGEPEAAVGDGRVTIIVVTTLATQGSTMLEAVYHAERQDFDRDLVDITMVLNTVGPEAETQMRVFGAERADTEWVCFLDERDRWPATRLRQMFALLDPDGPPGVALQDGPDGCVTFLVRRDYYLAQMTEGASE